MRKYLCRRGLKALTEPDNVLLTLSLVNSLLILFVLGGLNYGASSSLSELLIFPVEDPPWMPKGSIPVFPVIGNHYFGDLLIFLGYAHIENPYALDGGYSPNSLPVALLFFKSLNLVGGYLRAATTMIVLDIVLVILITYFVSRKLDTKKALAFVPTLFLFSGPFLSMVDRGSVQMVALVAAIFGLYASGNKRLWLIGVGLLVLAISLKTYLVLLLLLPLSAKNFRFVFVTLGGLLISNVVMLTFLGGSPVDSAMAFFNATIDSGGGSERGFNVQSALVNLISLLAGYSVTVEFFRSNLILLWILPCMYVLCVGIIVTLRKLPNWFVLIVFLSLTQMVVPSSMVYAGVWMPIAALMYGRRVDITEWAILQGDASSGVNMESGSLRVIRLLTLGGLITGIAPNVVLLRMSEGVSIRPNYIVSPVFWMSAALLGAVISLRRWQSERSVSREASEHQSI